MSNEKLYPEHCEGDIVVKDASFVPSSGLPITNDESRYLLRTQASLTKLSSTHLAFFFLQGKLPL